MQLAQTWGIPKAMEMLGMGQGSEEDGQYVASKFNPMKTAQFFSKIKGKPFTFEGFKYAEKPENWIHGMSLEKKGLWREETHEECMERFKFNHPEYGTEQCWCPDCLGGETLTLVNKVCSKH